MSEVEFEFFVGTKIIFERGSRKRIGEELRERQLNKPLIVTDKGIISNNLLDEIIDSINQQKYECFIFDEVPPNPPSSCVKSGVEVFKDNGCDSLIAVGGGSSIDAAKAISMMTNND